MDIPGTQIEVGTQTKSNQKPEPTNTAIYLKAFSFEKSITFTSIILQNNR
jgi:hypothetical protein